MCSARTGLCLFRFAETAFVMTYALPHGVYLFRVVGTAFVITCALPHGVDLFRFVGAACLLQSLFFHQLGGSASRGA